MKKTLFGGCPWLFLWLIFPIMLCSCAVKHTVDSVQNYMDTNNEASIWRIEVFMIPIKRIAVKPSDELGFVLRSYNIKKMRFIGNAQILELSFRANNTEQANMLREQLLATGVVEQVNARKESN